MSAQYQVCYVTEVCKLDLMIRKGFYYVYAEHHLNVQGSACISQVLSKVGKMMLVEIPPSHLDIPYHVHPGKMLASRPDRQTNNCNTILTELVLVPQVRDDNQTDGNHLLRNRTRQVFLTWANMRLNRP
jgi:hypothetical protein